MTSPVMKATIRVSKTNGAKEGRNHTLTTISTRIGTIKRDAVSFIEIASNYCPFRARTVADSLPQCRDSKVEENIGRTHLF